MRVLLLALLLSLLTSCASIMGGTTRAVTVTSVPVESDVEVINQGGRKVYAGRTPFTVTLQTSRGYFDAELYTFRAKADGYPLRTTEVGATVSGWYFGNIIFGGVIGFLLIDPATGAMHTFPTSVVIYLDPSLDPANVKVPAQPNKEADAWHRTAN